MNKFLLRLSLAAAVTTSMLALNSMANAQQATTPQDSQTPTAAQSQTAPQNDMAPSSAESKPFTGTIVKEKGKLVLKDSSTNTSYKLDDQDKAKQYEGKQVKVNGKLDMNSNVIHVDSIEAPTT